MPSTTTRPSEIGDLFPDAIREGIEDDECLCLIRVMIVFPISSCEASYVSITSVINNVNSHTIFATTATTTTTTANHLQIVIAVAVINYVNSHATAATTATVSPTDVVVFVATTVNVVHRVSTVQLAIYPCLCVVQQGVTHVRLGKHSPFEKVAY